MAELDDLKKKIADGVRRHYETEEGKIHKQKLSDAMKNKWKKLKGDVNRKKDARATEKPKDNICEACCGAGKLLNAGIGQGFGLGEITHECEACKGTGKKTVTPNV